MNKPSNQGRSVLSNHLSYLVKWLT